MTPHLAAPPLATLPPHPGFWEMIEYQATGLIVVVLALSLLWAMMETLGAVFRRRDSAAAGVAPISPPPTPAPPPAKQESIPTAEEPTATPAAIPDHHIVVIAAAVHAALGPRARVISVSPWHDGRDWVIEGRRDIFAGHKLRR